MNLKKYLINFNVDFKNTHEADEKSCEFVEELLLGTKNFSFPQCSPDIEATDISIESLMYSFRDSVQKMTHSKQKAIDIYKLFLDYYLTINDLPPGDIYFPSIDISNNYEVLLYIIKKIQDPNYPINKLEDELWLSSRTIDDYLLQIKESGNNSIKMFGTQIDIGYCRRMGRVNSESSCHPLFLALNVSQVACILMGLNKMQSEPGFVNTANGLSDMIWSQLTDYGRVRLNKMFNDEFNNEWIKYRSVPEINSYLSEEKSYGLGTSDLIMKFYKSGKEFNISFSEELGEKMIERASFVQGSLHDSQITINHNNQEITIAIDEIIKILPLKE